jgi:hypothetical protein
MSAAKDTRHYVRHQAPPPKPYIEPSVTAGITKAMLTGARAPIAKVRP